MVTSHCLEYRQKRVETRNGIENAIGYLKGEVQARIRQQVAATEWNKFLHAINSKTLFLKDRWVQIGGDQLSTDDSVLANAIPRVFLEHCHQSWNSAGHITLPRWTSPTRGDKD